MSLRVLGLQCGPCLPGETLGDRLATLERAFDEALLEHPDADLVVFPELVATPYFCQTRDQTAFAHAETLDGETVKRFAARAKARGVFVLVTLFEKWVSPDNLVRYYNSAVLIDPQGACRGVYRKTHVPTLHLETLTTDEAYYFAPGDALPVFEVRGVSVGVLICFDRSFPEAARTLARQGAELIVIPAASSGAERGERWVQECAARAMENGIYVLGVNRAGHETPASDQSLDYFGKSCGCDPTGEVLAMLDAAPWNSVALTVDPEMIERTQYRLPLRKFLRDDLYGPCPPQVARVRQTAVDMTVVPSFGPRFYVPSLSGEQ